MARLEEDGFHVARIAPSQRYDDRALDLVQVVAFKDHEVKLVAVRAGPAKSADRDKLRALKRSLSNHVKVLEWEWRGRWEDPIELEIR